MKEGWEYKKLGEVGTFQRGKGIQKTDFVERGMPCIHYGQLHTVFGVATEKHLSHISRELYSKSIIASKNDVILALTSEDVEGSCRSTAWLGDYDVAVSSDAAVYKHSINPKFVAYYLRSDSFFIEKSKYARGFKVTHIKTSDIEKIPIPLPSLEVQQKVVSELDQINDLIRLKKEQLKEYDNLAQSIFYDMFGDPVENEKGWEVKKLKEVCLSITDGDHMPPPKSDSGIPFLTISDIDKETRTLNFGDTFYVPQEYYDKLKNDRKAMMGDLLYTVTGSYGIPVEVKTEQPFCFQRHIALIKVNKENILTNFLCHWVLCKSVKYMADRVATGIAQKTVGLNSLRNFDVILPPLPLQQEFSTRIEQIEKLKTEVQKTITDLETLLASRMQYWFE